MPSKVSPEAIKITSLTTPSPSAVPKSLLSPASSACNVILQYILHEISEFEEKSILVKVRVDVINDMLNPLLPHPYPQHQLIGIIQGLCDDIPPLLKSDVVSLSSMLKVMPLPDSLQRKPTDSSAADLKSLSMASLREDSTPKEAKRIRLDHSCEAIIEQLMTPIMESSTKRDSHMENDKNMVSPIGFSSSSHDTKVRQAN